MSISVSGSQITFNDGSTQDTAATAGLVNRIINGNMVIDQRNAGASVTPTDTGAGTYTVDRFYARISQASKVAYQQNAGSVTPPAGFVNYIGLTSTSAYSITSTDHFALTQAIEGLNVADLAWGTVNAQPITLSFWVRSSLTGTFGGSLANASVNRCYVYSYTISSANTWEYKTVTIAGDTSGTWATNNTVGLYINWNIGAGSSTTGTAGSWGSTFYRSVTGQTSVVGTNGATFYITGVDLRKGSTAPSAYNRDWRPYGTELQLCQRYYEVGLDRNAILWAGNTTLNGVYYSNKGFCVTKRASATVTTSNETIFGFGSGTPSLNIDTTGIQASRTAGSTTSAGYYFYNWTASAEL